MKDYFPFLLQKYIFFIDTCAFGLAPNEGVTKNSSMPGQMPRSIDFLTEETIRLRFLTEKLSKMENWLTIKEVVEEFEEGTEVFMRSQKRGRFSPLISAYGKLIDQRNKTYELFNQNHVISTANSPKGLDRNVKQSLPQIERIFNSWGGEINERNTDCKLVSTALTYAVGSPVGLFSHDFTMLIAFSDCATNSLLPIKPTYVLDEKREKVRPTKNYLKQNRHYFSTRGITPAPLRP